MTIKHDNILYIRDLSEIGGVETFIWEMIKKYHNLDIAVVYKTANQNQLERLEKYCPTYQHINQNIDCKVAIINYDVSIIPYITEKIWKENAAEDEGIYQVVHGDYENKAYNWKPPTDERIKEYIGVTQYIANSFKRITDNKNVTQHYNPLTINKHPLMLISMTRLSPIKGKDRMIKLANALDNAGIEYIWYVFTNDTDAIKNPNVFYMKPRLDCYKWLSHADYLVQLSDTEALPYSPLEALYRNIPIIITPLPFLKEIGIEDGKNAYILEFDCSNINEVVKKMINIPKFEFKHLEDNYEKIFTKTKSKYNIEYIDSIAVDSTNFGKFFRLKDIVRANPNNNQYGHIYKGDRFKVPVDLFDYLAGDNPKNKKVIEKYIDKK